MSFTQFLAAEVMDHVFGKGAYTVPTIYVALSSSTPTESGGNVTEPPQASYARVATAAVDWNTATVADPSVMDNTNALTFPTAAEDWESGADMTHFVLYDASSGGNALAWGALTTPKPILDGDTAEYAVGAFIINLD